MAHPGYQVQHPFTMLRYVLVGVLVEIVDRDPQQLDALPVELWKVLCSWFFRYPHNNLYHGVFYKLVFKALRCNNEGALRMAVSKGRLVAQLVESHVDGDKVRMLTYLEIHEFVVLALSGLELLAWLGSMSIKRPACFCCLKTCTSTVGVKSTSGSVQPLAVPERKHTAFSGRP